MVMDQRHLSLSFLKHLHILAQPCTDGRTDGREARRPSLSVNSETCIAVRVCEEKESTELS